MVSIFEFLQSSTVKINCTLKDSNKASGTGFFYQLNVRGSSVNVIVTNKHVIEDSVEGILKITTALDKQGTPNYNDIFTINLKNFESSWIMHPEKDIDLCVMPADFIFMEMKKTGKDPIFAAFKHAHIPNYNDTSIYKPTEEIYMIGYPNGLWDAKNNLPLIRRGITSTPFFINHNGEPEFIIDCACFPGSSGSPIVIANESSYALHKQPLQSGNRIVLLGILHAGPQYNAEGEIKKYKVPTKYVETNIPMNLGYCIQSKKLLDFIPIIEKLVI